MPHKEIVEDVCSDCRQSYCTLKEVVLHSGLSDRTLEQLKMVELLKWKMGEERNGDVTWHEAWTEFTGKYAARFAEVYKDGMKRMELYHEVIGLR